MDLLQIVIVIGILMLIAKPLGNYLFHVFSNEPNRTDKLFGWAEKTIYAVIGLKQRVGMSWK
ncbi:MAG: potassium-transporting ATPase subunit KdpA, partial [Paenibacillaceae bacterium]|nr:potassium-transporting ATPase subunit KdpA [Paenibacillaceae bacterium]